MTSEKPKHFFICEGSNPDNCLTKNVEGADGFELPDVSLHDRCKGLNTSTPCSTTISTINTELSSKLVTSGFRLYRDDSNL